MWNPSTIWNSVAFLTAAAGFCLLAWALFADRAKGRLRCPKCWYSLDGTPADDAGLRKCSECGRGSLRERSLKRTRRRWRYALLALLVFIFADQSRRIPAANQHGWVAFVPTTLIIPLAPIQSERWVRQTLGGADHMVGNRWSWLDTLRQELFRRDHEEKTWIWQGSVWALLAAWGPLEDERLVSKSFDVRAFVDQPGPAPIDLVGTSQLRDVRQEIVDIVCQNVNFESWIDNGGTQGTAKVLGRRILIVHHPNELKQCEELLSSMRARQLSNE